jgi:transposase InsO family protein
MDDKVNRLFIADRPNKLWVSDFTYVQTWSGTVYVAFVIDVFARRIVGWRASTSMKTQFVLPSRQICFANRLPTARQCIENAREGAMDALEQAIWQRKTPNNKSLIHHSDRGSQYLSIKYTERLAEAEIELSVGTVGDAYPSRACKHALPGNGQRLGGMRDWPVQNPGHQPDRAVEIHARGRMGSAEMGRLV